MWIGPYFVPYCTRPVRVNIQQISSYSTDGRIRRLPVVNFGPPRPMTATYCLALYLAWNRAQGSSYWICLVFGITKSVAELFIHFARRILVRALRNKAGAAITMPSVEEIGTLKEAILERHPLLTDVFCVADGLKLRLQQSGDRPIQAAYYNGWTHDHYVSNVLVFAPNGQQSCRCRNWIN